MNNESDLKKAGLKVTTPRRAILRIFETTQKRHLSAEDIYRLLQTDHSDIGLATVYRVLAQFESAKLITRHNFEGDDQAVFELDQGIHHDHLICVNCSKIEEFVDDEIERRQEQIAHKYGYLMTDHALNIYGVCSSCRKNNAK